jgi:hypothetical protein
MVDIASKFCLGFGGLLVLAGISWLVVNAVEALRRRPPKPKAGAAGAGPTSFISDILKAMTAFLKELRNHPKPFRLIILGVLLLLVGAGLSVASGAAPGSS